MSAFDPARDEDRDPYWDYDDNDCWNCGGEGFVYGCSWDWQCETYDAGEDTCLCTRRCHVCNPVKPDPELQRVLAEALARDSGSDRNGEDAPQSAAEGEASQSGLSDSEGIAHPHPPKETL